MSSDSFVAPVNPERREQARLQAESLSARLRIHLNGHFQSTDLHGLAEELDGLSRQFRAMAENSVDDYQDPTVRQYRVLVKSVSQYVTTIECTDAEKWAIARDADGGEFEELGEGTWQIESVEEAL